MEKRVQLSPDRVERLSRLAELHQVSEDHVIEKALDILFSLTEIVDSRTERGGWSSLSEDALRRVWDNDEDARYDNWHELYGAPTR